MYCWDQNFFSTSGKSFGMKKINIVHLFISIEYEDNNNYIWIKKQKSRNLSLYLLFIDEVSIVRYISISRKVVRFSMINFLNCIIQRLELNRNTSIRYLVGWNFTRKKSRKIEHENNNKTQPSKQFLQFRPQTIFV